MQLHASAVLGKRNVPVDAFRGILALLVAAYHSMGWLGLPIPSWLKVTGLMGVDAFFVISGYALTRVYGDTDWRRLETAAGYVAKRVARIAPLLFFATVLALAPSRLLPVVAGMALLWLVLRRRPVLLVCSQAALVVAVLGQAMLRKPDVSAWPTLSLLWGFVDPTLSLPTGSWSIGVELVFYFVLPLLLLAARRNRWAMLGLLLLACLAAVAFQLLRDTLLQPGMPAQNWRNYTAVPHHAYFFVAGMALAVWQPYLRASPRTWVAVVLLASAVYVLSAKIGPASQGWARAWFAVLAIAIVSGVAMLEVVPLPAAFSRLLILLGEASYGLYMLHPAVFTHVHRGSAWLAGWMEVGLTLVATLGLALLTRKVFERPFEQLRSARRKPVPAGLVSRA